MKKVIIVGGGAAGFFAAINAKEANPNLDIIILEKGKEVLQKVKISGGGRCNVTHACFDPKELTSFYPRGEKELLGPFHQFMTGDTFDWFDENGIPLKIEEDGRVFPESNSSQTIIDCFLDKINQLKISILKNQGVISISKNDNTWIVKTKQQDFFADALVIAAGSSKQIWKLCEGLGHTIINPVPSLFTFAIQDSRIQDLAGISVPSAEVKIQSEILEASGPLLITHWGMSGPAILKLSAFGARILADKNYNFKISINWLSQPSELVLKELQRIKQEQTKKRVLLKSPFETIPKRLWERLVLAVEISFDQNWADINKKQIQDLANELTEGAYQVHGKSTFKEEFVTAGGIDLREINFKRFESRLHQNLFFVGEVLNIDAVTGGFNFQNAWTGGWLCAKAIAEDSIK